MIIKQFVIAIVVVTGITTHPRKVPDRPIPVLQLQSWYPKCWRLEQLLLQKL